MLETRTEQIARIRRNGLLTEDLERELIRAEQRGASRRAKPTPLPSATPRKCLPRRVLEYLRSNEATVLQMARALGAGLNQTHRAVKGLERAGRIRVVRTIENSAFMTRSTRVFGRSFDVRALNTETSVECRP